MTISNGDGAKRLDFDGEAILAWCRGDNWPAETMIYAGAVKRQVMFMRDTLPSAFAADGEEYRRHSFATEDAGTVVASTHRSKSCTLPVYGIDVRSLGLRAVVRDNFHNWKVSVEAPCPVDLALFKSRVNLSERIAPCYCEGFREEWVLGAHAENPRAFTVEMGSEHDVYALFLSMAAQLRGDR